MIHQIESQILFGVASSEIFRSGFQFAHVFNCIEVIWTFSVLLVRMAFPSNMNVASDGNWVSSDIYVRLAEFSVFYFFSHEFHF